MMTPTHEDPDFCRECGETVLALDLTERQRLVANGSQMTVSAGARAMRKNTKNALKERGYHLARNHIARHPGFTPFRRCDVAYVVLYPRRQPNADPDNFFPTLKPVVDGLTLGEAAAAVMQMMTDCYVRISVQSVTSWPYIIM